jgi:hypothetical protein
MSELTKVRKVINLTKLISDKSETPNEVIELATKWFAEFCDKRPCVESIDFPDNNLTGCRVSFVAYLTPEELEKYYEFEKLIDEGKI